MITISAEYLRSVSVSGGRRDCVCVVEEGDESPEKGKKGRRDRVLEGAVWMLGE